MHRVDSRTRVISKHLHFCSCGNSKPILKNNFFVPMPDFVWLFWKRCWNNSTE